MNDPIKNSQNRSVTEKQVSSNQNRATPEIFCDEIYVIF
mgnify:FL=1|jgi:hypothetical protein